VHLEGQGSRARGEEYRGAAISNRYFFTAAHGDHVDSQNSVALAAFAAADARQVG
jgi:hypothetical protein